MPNERTMLSGRVDPEVKSLVDAYDANNQDVLNRALWQYFGGEKKSTIETRIENKRKQLKAAEEALEAERENVRQIQEELDSLIAQREEFEQKEAAEEELFEAAKDDLETTPRNPESDPIQYWANKLGMPAEQLCKELPPIDENDGLASLGGDA
jgi:chromosome segregation ATPase